MHDNLVAHQRFLALVEAFFTQSGRACPPFESDASSAIAFEVDVDDVTFSVGYDPLAGRSSLFAYSVLGRIHAVDEATVLRRLLEHNVTIGQQYDATFCMDAETREVACYMRRSTTDTDADQLRASLVQLAELVRQWQGNLTVSAVPHRPTGHHDSFVAQTVLA